MPINIEIKARCKDFATMVSRIGLSPDTVRVEMDQEDTFFNVPRGKLKMRYQNDGHGELIYYRRQVSDGIMTSCYFREPTAWPEMRRAELSKQYGVKAVVRKHRIAFLRGDLRIHLDDVQSLGKFVEIEVRTSAPEGRNKARVLAMHLMDTLGIAKEDLLVDAYEDLLEQTTEMEEKGSKGDVDHYGSAPWVC